ncbi:MULTISPECIES: DUF3168 domain-containing protein [unclassified Ensifer]|uniref:DUF3168 domain-containing protein n=1 Tax=unclassified Ensifer TaxID=2633371 RepID=UPI000812FF34|nr:MULTISPECIES: DUF3168 domain-containing protein [unclassified Ensifer]OCP17024.1 hypothetical protein BC360_12360 [Ensifer sp. LC163]OCP24147.1 hypothetical protein BC363_23215 [Ensifer sp. LC384]OCP25620.1 hypothetical protein BC361_17480 [Ensifer sp. LC54]
MEPVLALQTAIRTRLLDKPEVTALVPADHIRAGSTRPDKTPCIVMSDGTTTLHGNDYASQSAAWVYLDLHIWTPDAGQDAAKEITGTLAAALSKYNLPIEGGYCDHFKVTGTRFPRDPKPEYGHGVLSVEALIRWVV